MTNNFQFTLSALSMSAFVLGFASLASAQATRTWVSGVGDDANPCSRTAPCKTFAGAISKTAAGGEIDVLDPGGFGAVTITKSITIDGAGTMASVLVGGTNGINVAGALGTEKVTLRNLSINGLGTGISGIKFTNGATLRVQNCNIFNFTNGIEVAYTGMTRISVIIEDTTVAGSSSNGLLLNSTGTYMSGTLRNSTITGSGVVGMMMNPGVGVNAQSGALLDVFNSFITHSTTNGILQQGLTFESVVTVVGSTLVYDNTAIKSAPGGLVLVSGDTFANNVMVFDSSPGGSIVSTGDNVSHNNPTGSTPGTSPKI